MRWNLVDKWDSVEVGDIRITSKFLLLPKCIDGECRWLEKVTYAQECIEETGYASMDYSMYKQWKDLEWIEGV